jgi:UBX domain-containing protein 7
VIPGVSIPQISNWSLEEALQLFFINGESALASHPAPPAASVESVAAAEEAMR